MNIFNRFKSLCENIIGGPLPKQPEEKELTQKQIERILWYHEEVSKTIRRVFYILVGSCLFCIITLALPDDKLLLSDATVILPVINFKISFLDFIVIGPVVLIGLTIYIHILYGNLPSLGSSSVSNVRILPTLFNIDGLPAKLITWLMFYWMPPIVVSYFAWKALPHPQIGLLLTYVTIILAFGMILSQVRRCPIGWRRWALPLLSMIGMALLVTSFLTAVSGPPFNRTLNLIKSNFSGKDLRDLDFSGAILQKANLINTDLRGANFTNADLTGAKLSGANLLKVKFEGANVQNANFGKDIMNNKEIPAASELPLQELTKANNWFLALYSNEQLKLLGLKTDHYDRIKNKNLRGVIPKGANLRNVDLIKFDLSDADLEKSDLTGANLQGTILRGVNFTGANLTGANLKEANLQGATFKGAKISKYQLMQAYNWVLATYSEDFLHDLGLQSDHNNAVTTKKLAGLNLQNLNLREANLSGFDLSDADLRKSDLTGANLQGTILRGVNFTDANLTGANLKEANLQGATFDGRNITPQQFQQANNSVLAFFSKKLLKNLNLETDHNDRIKLKKLRGVVLENFNLQGADLRGFDLSYADLKNADLTGAKLNNADLSRAILIKADLTKADLEEAIIDNADLSHAILAGTKLKGASMIGVNLTKARITGTTNITNADLTNAILSWDDQKKPFGLKTIKRD